MKQFILFISLCLSTNAMFAQVDYVRIHPASETIYSYQTVAETNSGGFLVAMDFSIWKIDQNYNVIWRKSCDSTSFFQLHELSNQNIAFSGYEFDENQNTYACIGVLDPNGNQLWSKRFATPMYEHGAHLIKETGDGIFFSMNDNYGNPVYKTDFSGNILFSSKIYNVNGTSSSVAGKTIFTGNRIFHLMASNWYLGGDEVLLTCTDTLGTILWSKELPATTLNMEEYSSGKVILGQSGPGNNTLSVICVDSNGNVEWAKKYTQTVTPVLFPLTCYSIFKLANGNFHLIGKNWNNTTYHLIIDNVGNLVSSTKMDDHVMYQFFHAQEKIISYEFLYLEPSLLMFANETGPFHCVTTLEAFNETNYSPVWIAGNVNSNTPPVLQSVSHVYQNVAFENAIFQCIDPDGVEETNATQIMLFPNPAQEWISIEGMKPEFVSIFNQFGQLVLEMNTTTTQKIFIGDLANGVYFIQGTGKNQTFRGTFIKH
jgi:hypothetical protein